MMEMGISKIRKNNAAVNVSPAMTSAMMLQLQIATSIAEKPCMKPFKGRVLNPKRLPRVYAHILLWYFLI
jgi:hypothetical protein